MEQNLTPEIKKWLDTPEKDRDIEAGATLMLRINRNRILYNNIIRRGEKGMDLLEYNLRKIYNFRLQEINKAEVANMLVKVEGIEKAYNLKGPEGRPDFRSGKRADHDSLPAQVQQLYVDNADIRHQMRDVHTQLRLINPSNSSCPDSDRYPLAKRLIELDRLYRENWQRYDNYRQGMSVEDIPLNVDRRTESRNAAKTCTLLLGKFAKSPSEDLAKRIRALYKKIDSPSASLAKKYAQAGL